MYLSPRALDLHPEALVRQACLPQVEDVPVPSRLFHVTCWSPKMFKVATSVHFYALVNREPHPPLERLFSTDYGSFATEDVRGTDELFREEELAHVRDFVERKLGWEITITEYQTPLACPQVFNEPARFASSVTMGYGLHCGQLAFVTDSFYDPRFQLRAFWARDDALPWFTTNPQAVKYITARMGTRGN